MFSHNTEEAQPLLPVINAPARNNELAINIREHEKTPREEVDEAIKLLKQASLTNRVIPRVAVVTGISFIMALSMYGIHLLAKANNNQIYTISPESMDSYNREANNGCGNFFPILPDLCNGNNLFNYLADFAPDANSTLIDLWMFCMNMADGICEDMYSSFKNTVLGFAGLAICILLCGLFGALLTALKSFFHIKHDISVSDCTSQEKIKSIAEKHAVNLRVPFITTTEAISLLETKRFELLKAECRLAFLEGSKSRSSMLFPYFNYKTTGCMLFLLPELPDERSALAPYANSYLVIRDQGNLNNTKLYFINPDISYERIVINNDNQFISLIEKYFQKNNKKAFLSYGQVIELIDCTEGHIRPSVINAASYDIRKKIMIDAELLKKPASHNASGP